MRASFKADVLSWGVKLLLRGEVSGSNGFRLEVCCWMF